MRFSYNTTSCSKLLLIFTLILLELLHTLFASQLASLKRSKRQFFIVDGTRWCGNGNIAANCTDLGYLTKTDACCRQHDYCPYTFTVSQPEYNGFRLNSFFTISHCECDKIFHDCLHEKPYKEGSYYMWSSFRSLDIRCFAYLPCDNNNNHDNIWRYKAMRNVGNCTNNLRVMEFYSYEDYTTYLDTHLQHNQLTTTYSALATRYDMFITKLKKAAACFKFFSDYSANIADNFARRFLPSEKLVMRAKTSSPSKNVFVDDIQNEEGNTADSAFESTLGRIINIFEVLFFKFK